MYCIYCTVLYCTVPLPADCSRFWECGPSGGCMFECAPCPAADSQCGDSAALAFDCR